MKISELKILNTPPQSSSSTSVPVIELKNLHKSYGDLEVLKGISLSAKRGDVTALIGSSGSGKSTLLRCANLLEVPASGDIVFNGEQVKWKKFRKGRIPADQNQVRKMRSNLSMVFQQFNLWAHLSVLQNITQAPVFVLGKDRTEAEEFAMTLLDKVGIADKADQFPAQLSGGQQQRAAIARALAMEPDAMLFDEPTSALDPELEAEVVQVIKQLAQEGSTMIIVTHDMKLAYEVANHVIFLHDGSIIEQGTPHEVFIKTQSDRLKGFLQSTGSFGQADAATDVL